MNLKQRTCHSLLAAAAAASLTAHSTANAAYITPGSLIITEVMANPAAVSDTLGEWFEVYNSAATPIDLDGLELRDDGSNSHVIDDGGSLWVAPGEYFVFGRSGDPDVNGGYAPDYVYSNFSLANSSDAIVLVSQGVEVARLNYSNGNVFGAAGISAEIAPGAGFPFLETDYALTPPLHGYGAGDIGTPGGPGSSAMPAPVPLPAALWLLGSGLVGLSAIRRRHRG